MSDPLKKGSKIVGDLFCGRFSTKIPPLESSQRQGILSLLQYPFRALQSTLFG
jgi:hypothetical protein